jgi:hypothetical protein
MVVFVLGLLLGVVLVLAVLWWLGRDAEGQALGSYSRSSLRDIERQTIREMLAVEMDARRSEAASPPPAGGEFIEGTAVEVERQS